MKNTRFIQKILSSLTTITFVSLSGNMAFAGIDLSYPGSGLDSNGHLIPQGSVSDNTVTISGGEIKGNAYGGKSASEAVTNNTVTISGGKIFGLIGDQYGQSGNVYGGYSDSGEVTGNTIMISGGEIGYAGQGRDIYGGKSDSGVVTNNSITISGGTIAGSFYGGYSGSGEVTGNTVMISGGRIEEISSGGTSEDGVVTNNSITISGGELIHGVSGGRSDKGAATGNTVTISGGKVGYRVFGGYSTDEEATGNTVMISGGEISGQIYGGYAGNSWGSGGKNTGNTVAISGGVIKARVIGGSSDSGEVTGNTVTISGGNIEGKVYGGISSSGAATGNTVAISGGELSGDVYGGFAPQGESTDNTVILNSGTTLSANSSIFGGFSTNTDADAFSGNKLVLNDFQGTVKQIANFEFINITSSGKEGDMLTLAGGEITDLSQSKVNIAFTGIAHPFNTGDKINLIKNDAGITMGSATLLQDGQKQVKGTAYIYDLLFGSDENTIYATVEGKKFNDRSKALAEGRVASIAHVNMGGDLVAGQGMAQAFDPDKLKGKIHLFSAMSATDSQYDTGSHVDLYGYAALVGASISPKALPSLNCGLFAESGWGHYGSFSEFEDGGVRGSGSSEYYGGGLLTHYDFTKLGVRGLSVEASFRAGKTDSDFQSGDLPNSKYDLSTPYYGVHAGVNYSRELTSKLKIANYARFLWSHLDGDNTTIEGSDFRFRTMDSQRIQAGSRLFYEQCDCFTPYAGLSYEWECSGTARAVVDGANGMAAPSLRGGTGTGELGAVWKPMANQAFWVDFSVQGHVGERQGVSGVVRLRAEF